MSSIKAILFDLDGTLADTAPDLADALNKTLAHENKPHLSFDEIRPAVSHGGAAMIKLAFNIVPEHTDYQRLREKFLAEYLANIACKTKLFPGMQTLLAEIEAKQLIWGVITNKPSWLTDPLMHALDLTRRAACIVSGDTATKSKPHPEPMLYACAQINIAPEYCIYVGDAERDITAGRSVGMKTITALFGYLQQQDIPSQWNADAMINHPAEIWSHFEKW